MSIPVPNQRAYRQVDVETASQGKLVIMLFNGAIQRAEEAKRQMEKGQLQGIHNNLIRAQDIIAELRGSLNMKTGPIAANLDRIYEYVQHLLIQANVRKETQPIDEAIEHMASLRDTWEEAFAKAGQEEAPKVPKINQHGAGMLNVQG